VALVLYWFLVQLVSSYTQNACAYLSNFHISNHSVHVYFFHMVEICSQRRDRMCCFCNAIIKGGKLKRHIKSHKITHEEVAYILKKNTNEQNKGFERKRIKGMYNYNVAHLTQTELMTERKPKKQDEVRMCMKCKRFFFQIVHSINIKRNVQMSQRQ
jgi:hypothetical protein